MRRLVLWLSIACLLPAVARACPWPETARAPAHIAERAIELTVASDMDWVAREIAATAKAALAALPKARPLTRVSRMVGFWQTSVQPRIDGFAAAAQVRARVFAWLEARTGKAPAAPRSVGRAPRLLDIAREAITASDHPHLTRSAAHAAMRAIARAHR
jgi:hypothetical protein